jgi:hypothetical protein
MLAYMASEDPTKITRERVDLNAPVAQDAGRGGRGGGRGGPRTWPECATAPRQTRPRM